MIRSIAPHPEADAEELAELGWEEFEARYQALVRAHEEATDNERCVQCEHCRACSACTFCRHSEHLNRCHYCVECAECTDCSHCQASRGLLSCHHCADTEDSMGSSYLVRCSVMVRCNYCFGCVGLNQKDYYILNQPCDRSLYFEVTRKLQRLQRA